MIHSPPGGAGIGLPVVSGSNNSVLFVNPAGVLAQDNANFSYTAAGGLVATKLSSGNVSFTGGTAALSNGSFSAPSLTFQDLTTGWYRNGAQTWDWASASGVYLTLAVNSFKIDQNTTLGWTNSNSTGTADIILSRDGVGQLALKGASNAAAESRVYAGNGGFISQVKSVTEQLTIAAAATTVGATSIPAGAILLGVSVRVTTVIPTAATFTITTTVGGTTLNTAAVSVAANSTDPGTAAGASYRAAATTVTITPNLTPGTATGVVRLQYYYLQVTPPTS